LTEIETLDGELRFRFGDQALCIVLAHDKAGVQFLDRPRRREAAFGTQAGFLFANGIAGSEADPSPQFPGWNPAP
jgi:hypothetical protein